MHKLSGWRFLAAFVTLFVLASNAHAQVEIEQSVFSSAGDLSTSEAVTLVSVVGQASPVGVATDGTFTLQGGLLAADASTLVSAPVVAHTPPPNWIYRQEKQVVASVASAAGVERALLYFRRGSDAGYASVEMARGPQGFQAVVPANAVTEEGIAYYISVLDSAGNMVRAPFAGFYTARVEVTEPGLTKNQPLPGGTESSAYRLISVPLDLRDKNPGAVLADDLGSYDNTEWRFFELLFSQDYAEYPSTSAMEPGNAFWIITRTPGKTFDTGPGLTAPLDRLLRIPLHPRWNFIGNPYAFPLPASRLRTQSGQDFALRSFENGWNDPVRNPVSGLRPFEGYAIFNSLQTVDTLVIDPQPSASSAESTYKSSLAVAERSQWEIRIAAQSGSARDADNIAAVMPGASAGWDRMDLPEPPVIGGHLSVYFSHPEWGTASGAFCTDYRPGLSRGEVWVFELETGKTGSVQLSFDGVADVPPEYQVWLVDEATRIVQDLRADNRYRLAMKGGAEPARLKLVVGKDGFLEGVLDGEEYQPDTFDLSSVFPNPFQAQTVVRYGLSESQPVTLVVYNMLGERVAVLLQDEAQQQGYHAVVWDGVNTLGQPLASGVYLVHLRAGGRTATRKVVLIR